MPIASAWLRNRRCLFSRDHLGHGAAANVKGCHLGAHRSPVETIHSAPTRSPPPQRGEAIHVAQQLTFGAIQSCKGLCFGFPDPKRTTLATSRANDESARTPTLLSACALPY